MQVRSIILVAGPSGVGKSHFIDSLGTASGKGLASELGISSKECFELLHAKDVTTQHLSHERLMIHYDIARPWKQGFPFDYAREPVLSSLSSAESLAIVTLWLPRELLVTQFVRRQRLGGRLLMRASRALPTRLRHRSALALKLYRNPVEYSRMYSSWFQFCQSLPSQAHWLLDYRGGAPVAHPVFVL